MTSPEIDLGTDGLPGRRVAVQYLPPVGQGVDEYESAAVFVEG